MATNSRWSLISLSLVSINFPYMIVRITSCISNTISLLMILNSQNSALNFQFPFLFFALSPNIYVFQSNQYSCSQKVLIFIFFASSMTSPS